jgi:RNA polymerase sigma-70 factor, ECF subfamily
MHDAFDRFYQRHLPLIRAMALAKTGAADRADDLVQETMLRAWRAFDVLRERDDAAQRAWLLVALRHRAIEAWRRAPDESELSEMLCAPTADSALRLDVLRALQTLSDEERELIVLRHFEGCDSAEIGQLLDLPPGTVRRRLSEARQKLERALESWRKP